MFKSLFKLVFIVALGLIQYSLSGNDTITESINYGNTKFQGRVDSLERMLLSSGEEWK